MDLREWNKLGGGVLVTLLLAMVISFVADALIPEDAPLAPAPAKPETVAVTPDKKPPETKPPAEKTLTQLLAEATADQGKAVSKRCAACHSFNKGGRSGVGPNLWNVVGRQVASVSGYSYSSGLKDKGGTWDYGNLDKFLANPRGFGSTKMTFRLRKSTDRARILVFLRTLSDNPKPLPK